jgi:hypothetical protein
VNKLIIEENNIKKYDIIIYMADTKLTIVCVKCNTEKSVLRFPKNRSQCKDCDNEIKRLKYKEDEEYRTTRNEQRRLKYNNNEEHRRLLIKRASEFKHNKVIERQKRIAQQQEAIGIDNKLCKYCKVIKSKERFRHNRLKCKDCERDEPISTIVRSIRSRILSCLKRKYKHTIEYLGCNCTFYLDWILNVDTKYTFENYGTEWHIDHVIPLSKFDLNDEEQQLVAFNWRNTMPLSVKENLSKNNKILQSQIQQHVSNLLEYHKKNNIEMPQKFIDLFATHSN